MPRLNWTLPLPVTENLLEVMPLSALLHPQVSACHAISKQTWALGSLATRSSCLLSRLLALRNLITALSLDSLLFCPVYGPRFKPQMTCFTEFQKQVLDRLTDLYPNTDFFFFSSEAFSKNGPCASIPRAVPGVLVPGDCGNPTDGLVGWDSADGWPPSCVSSD